MNSYLKSIFILFSAFVITACTTRVSDQKTYQNKDFVGKTYTKQNDTTPANYGGAAFVSFKENQEAHIKLGDMVQLGTYQINGNQINVSANNEKWIFQIVNANTLKENNQTWVSK